MNEPSDDLLDTINFVNNHKLCGHTIEENTSAEHLATCTWIKKRLKVLTQV